MKRIYAFICGICALSAFTSCENKEVEFDDFDYQTVYFAKQTPIRTIVLGNDDEDDRTLDNQHQFQVYATVGGVWKNKETRQIQVAVDNSLCAGRTYEDGSAVTPLPEGHYRMLGNTISIKPDSVMGCVTVQLTDAFFNDPKAIENTYVIPLLMTGKNGFDHILTGTLREGLDLSQTSRTNTEDWDVLAKDYVLYCVKYMNPWQAKYIRRGVDNVTEKGVTTQVVRKDFSLVNSDLEHFKENPVNQNDEVCAIRTKNMTQAIFPVSFKTSGASISCNLILTFNGNQCSITTDDENVTATGSGEFIEKGTEKAEYKDYQWGSNNGQPVQRDILRLAYDVKFDNKNIQVSTTDTLVVQTRESNKREFYTPKYVKQ